MKPQLYSIDPTRPLAGRIARLEHATLIPVTYGPYRAKLGGVLDHSDQYAENLALTGDTLGSTAGAGHDQSIVVLSVLSLNALHTKRNKHECQ